ncbi:MAG: transporter substrate-binding domain-containing protein, partial [Anaerolineae bacterium]|nr:transporter substrate-binding domain-containing protein [Anaerolineae bacterium]
MHPKHERRLLIVALIATVIALLFGLTIRSGSDSRAAAQGDSTATATMTPIPTDVPTATPLPTSTPVPSATPTVPAPTLVPPTPWPTTPPDALELANMSGLAHAQEQGTLRVGTVFNAYPFVWLDEFGEITGYEADIMAAIGIELGVEVEYVQVTRHNADRMLIGGQIDVLIGQQVHTRDREDSFDFTHSYYVNQERMVILTDAPYNSLGDLAGQSISVEIGSRSERALRQWMVQNSISYDVRTYFTESAALDALAAGEVQGMVGELDSLRRAGRQGMRLIEQPVLDELYSVVVRRWDANLLDLLNRSLQRLKASGRLKEIAQQWFPNETVDFNTLVPVYEMLYEDERTLDQFSAEVPYPATTVLDRLANGQPLRVAGLLTGAETDSPAHVRILNALNQALIDEIARRWGIQVQAVPNSAANAVDLVAVGQADIAVGINPDWYNTERVAYSLPYVQHTDRLLIPHRFERQIVSGFGDMLGTGWWIGYFADDPHDAELIKKWAQMFGVGQNVNEPFAISSDSRALPALVEQNNVDVIYG